MGRAADSCKLLASSRGEAICLAVMLPSERGIHEIGPRGTTERTGTERW